LTHSKKIKEVIKILLEAAGSAGLGTIVALGVGALVAFRIGNLIAAIISGIISFLITSMVVTAMLMMI